VSRKGFADSRVHLVDTPRINEVDGRDRARMAAEATQRADLILFVTDSDLNNYEHAACRELAATGRPLLLVFNKCDQYSSNERRQLVQVFQRRLAGIISPEDIVEVSADPLEREYVIESVDGTERTEIRKPAPKIGPLKERILEVLERDGKALLALNAAMFTADKTDRIAALRVELRNSQANKVIWSYAVTKGVAVGLNPIPIADVLGGNAVDVTMIVHVGRIFGIQMSRAKALDLIKSIAWAAGGMTLMEGLTNAAATIFKGLTVGAGTLVMTIL
jgi:GTPase SAR1 family protein